MLRRPCSDVYDIRRGEVSSSHGVAWKQWSGTHYYLYFEHSTQSSSLTSRYQGSCIGESRRLLCWGCRTSQKSGCTPWSSRSSSMTPGPPSPPAPGNEKSHSLGFHWDLPSSAERLVTQWPQTGLCYLLSHSQMACQLKGPPLMWSRHNWQL